MDVGRRAIPAASEHDIRGSPVIHYHGTPITPRSKLIELGGRHFCVSYASPRDVGVCHEIGQSVMLDNGAFSFWRQRKPVDWDGYYEFCDEWLRYWTTWAVIPDVIDGSEDENDVLIEEWPYGDMGSPVWHLHESLERLVRLVQGWDRVCFGSSGDFEVVGDEKWHRRMYEAMDAICERGETPPAWLHMLRGLALCGSVYPFASADSTNIARNHAGARGRERKLVHLMANQIDCVQCPPIWDP